MTPPESSASSAHARSFVDGAPFRSVRPWATRSAIRFSNPSYRYVGPDHLGRERLQATGIVEQAGALESEVTVDEGRDPGSTALDLKALDAGQ